MLYKTKPYDHQLTAYNKAYGKPEFALFMEMGTGKTKVSIDLASNYFNDMQIDAVMIVAPNSVHRQWAVEQVPEHCPVENTTFVWSAVKSTTKRFIKDKEEFFKSDKLKFFCINVETFSSANHIDMVKQFLKDNRTLLIVDESTIIKTPEAKRTKSIVKIGKLAKYRLILTGTPVTNSPFDLWSQFEFLKQSFFGCNYFVFRHRYGIEISDRNPWTGKKFKRLMRPKEIAMVRSALARGDDEEEIEVNLGISAKNINWIKTHEDIVQPYKALDKLKNAIQDYTYTVKKKDCLDLPDKVYSPISAEMSKEQKRVYMETKKRMMARYGDKELTVLNKVSLLMRLQQITGGFFPYDPENGEAKAPVLIGKSTAKFDRLKQDLEETGKDQVIIIWSHFTAEIKYLHRELSKMYPDDRIETYYGGTVKTKGNREHIIEDFKKGEVKILIANPASAGIGLNLQRSNLHYYYSNDFSLERRLQSEDRSHRIGQKSNVTYKDIVIKGSVDEMIHRSLKNKEDILKFFMDKDLKEILDMEELIF